ncbi:MAG: radical SAM protein [Pseudomonadales bacterium]|nr:radical SAM protein [Pseudomonadales bacterium]NIX06554.1 radical SAM protein [Pseudomonadales bacterium]
MAEIIARSAKFADPTTTAEGKPRASVAPTRLSTLWINTGTLCNLTCENCYIESSPTNDRLVHISRGEVRAYLEEIAESNLGTDEIGFTGGEPFMNPDIMGMLKDSLRAGHRVLVLTNAMRPMMKHADGLLALAERYGSAFTLRVSVDHFDPECHRQERGARSWQPMIEGLRWLSRSGFGVNVAGRTRWGEDEETLRAGFATLFAAEGISIDTQDPTRLVLFPEMDAGADVPEITTECWELLGVRPEDQMCASSRMVVKRKGAQTTEVVACTLLPHDDRFAMGPTLLSSLRPVPLNHPHCAKFCVLGGGSCSA